MPKTSLGEKCLHIFPTVPPPDSPVTVARLPLCHTLVLPHTTTEASGGAAGSVTRVLRRLCAKGRCVCGCLRVFVLCTCRRVSARCVCCSAAAARRTCWAFGHARMGLKTHPRAARTPANRSCGCTRAFLCRKFYFGGASRVCCCVPPVCARDVLYVE